MDDTSAAATVNSSDNPLTRLQAILILAKRGDPRVLPKLRQELDSNPELWKSTGDLAAQAQRLWLERLSGQDLLVRESVARFLQQMRADLASDNPSPLDRLLVAQVMAQWLQMTYYEAKVAELDKVENEQVGRFLHLRYEQAVRRFEAAVKTLARTRKMLGGPVRVEVSVTGTVETKVSGGEAESIPQLADWEIANSGSQGANRIQELLRTGRSN
jgi:hypothetical protein